MPANAPSILSVPFTVKTAFLLKPYLESTLASGYNFPLLPPSLNPSYTYNAPVDLMSINPPSSMVTFAPGITLYFCVTFTFAPPLITKL